ncbi:hypothetical protein H6F89_14220 [Cyanobacteria bacterium FACHB-63]|nr:hypothetical protein [Cyanobacteria bacterium FACHB-63]
MRRELWELITDILDSTTPQDAALSGIRVNSVDINLPVEVQAQSTEVGFRLLVDTPRSRWREGINERPTRLTIHLVIGGE